MKHFDRVLLCILWLVAVLLVACFWFDVRFGFDLLARDHWRFLAQAQVESAPISIWFYVSLLVFCMIAIAGMYLIWYAKGPRASKVSNAHHPPAPVAPTPLMPPAPVMQQYAPVPPPTVSQYPTDPRPPRLDIPIARQGPPQIHPVTQTVQPQPMPTVNANTVAVPHVNPATVKLAHVTLVDAGFTVKDPPKIGDIRPDIWAIGADEILYIGTICPIQGNIIANEGGTSKWRTGMEEFDSPVWKLTGAVERLRSLFAETLDNEIQIKIRPFVLMDGGVITNADAIRPIWDAFGAKVFANPEELGAFMATNRNRNLSEEELGDFDAYAEYIDTVAEYFNSQ